jgi:hypothetical protein
MHYARDKRHKRIIFVGKVDNDADLDTRGMKRVEAQ